MFAFVLNTNDLQNTINDHDIFVLYFGHIHGKDGREVIGNPGGT